MNARRNMAALAAPTIGVAALVLATLVAVIGSAQAAPSTKLYDASVRVTGGQVEVPDGQTSATSATLRLTLTNRGKQTLGSANFDPPDGVNPPAIPPDNVFVTSRPGAWTARFEDGVVKFRSSSSAVALTSGQEVWADVQVGVSGCASATWTTYVKQSNDFSGQPGNEVQPGSLDLTPLGSFAVDQVTTLKGGQTIPALETGTSFGWTATAYDLCGKEKASYSGGALSRTFLTNATFDPQGGLSLSWEQGIGTVTFRPMLTETGNKLTVTDKPTGVTESSNFFDVSDTICIPAAPGGVGSCQWDVKDNRGKLAIVADAASPPPNANLGIGFNSKLNFECNNGSTPVGDSVVNINPRGYPQPFTVSLTYKKSATGNGAASSFVVCHSKDNAGSNWSTTPNCPATPPCVQTQKRTSGGDLLIVLYLAQEDPWTGLG